MKKKKFTEPDAKLIFFENDDIITLSGMGDEEVEDYITDGEDYVG